MQAPADLKLPALYLLDSISKTIGDPYKTYFSPALPEVSFSELMFARSIRTAF